MPSLLPHDLCHGRSSSLAPSSDRIPVELFQILKVDAVESPALNMQYAICTQYAICRLTAVGESGLETLVTGGTAGIGKAIALSFASQGASVVIFGTNEERAA